MVWAATANNPNSAVRKAIADSHTCGFELVSRIEQRCPCAYISRRQGIAKAIRINRL